MAKNVTVGSSCSISFWSFPAHKVEGNGKAFGNPAGVKGPMKPINIHAHLIIVIMMTACDFYILISFT